MPSTVCLLLLLGKNWKRLNNSCRWKWKKRGRRKPRKIARKRPHLFLKSAFAPSLHLDYCRIRLFGFGSLSPQKVLTQKVIVTKRVRISLVSLNIIPIFSPFASFSSSDWPKKFIYFVAQLVSIHFPCQKRAQGFL